MNKAMSKLEQLKSIHASRTQGVEWTTYRINSLPDNQDLAVLALNLLPALLDLEQQRDTAWQELREIREAINANPEESTVDEVRRAIAQVEALRNGNTALLDALMGMVGQFFYGDDMEGELSHSFMSAEEQAIAVLIAAGMAEEVERGKNGYRLLWDKLDARKPKQKNWAEAVIESIADPVARKRLLALADDATPEQVKAAVSGEAITKLEAAQ